MGETEESVVDSELRVHGVSGLRVVERGAELIRQG